MHSDPLIIELLNEQLTAELTAINQYFLHAKMQEHRGYVKIAHWTRHESFDEMKHAETLTDRILLLEGLPNYQRLNALRVGQSLEEMYRADLALEMEAVERLRRGVPVMREKGDTTSANIFESILADEELHVDHLETHLALIAEVGEQLYVAQSLDQKEPSGH